ncbi:MAG: putative ABC exporter domain-containing protein [Oscillospiraceae bacterium]|jgi:hypothetical protein|nr:putative ABC exporter domain-containing protein [Oscillospiraceae bacterium]
MSALAYLMRRTILNKLRAMFRSVGSIISMVLVVALVALVFISSSMNGDGPMVYRPIGELTGGVLAVYVLLFVLIVKNGLNKGVSPFTMADVNLLFSAPVSNRRVLLYGLVKRLGTSLMLGFFILFQYSWMNGVYGIGVGFLIFAMLGYALTVFGAQLTAMVLYVLTSGNARRKRLATWGLVAVTGAVVLYVLVCAYLGQPDWLGGLLASLDDLAPTLYPVAGWLGYAVAAANGGDWLTVGLVLAATSTFVLLMVRLLTVTQADYYEDVLQSTETTHSAIAAAKEGKNSAALPENVRVGHTGMGKGWGASAFYYKHKLESRRARRFILDPMGLVVLGTVLVFTFFMRNEGLIGPLFFSVYMLFFTAATGRWVRELLLPYVFMVPEAPFKKLLQCLRESMQRMAFEAVLMAIGVALILKLTPVEGAAFALSRFSFALLFTAGLLLVERLFSGVKVKWLAMLLMFFVEILMMLPGIAAAIAVGILWSNLLGLNLTILLVPALLNIPVALFGLFLSRNVLQTTEITVVG